MAPVLGLSHLSNPLATPEQLANSASSLDGVPADLEDSIRYASARLIQVAGILLHLPQELIAASIMTFSRFWIGADGGSLLEYSASDVAAAAIYVAAKPSAHPVTPRQVLTAASYARASILAAASKASPPPPPPPPQASFMSDAALHAARLRLLATEAQLLRVLGYAAATHVALPYSLCINYLQALDALSSSTDVAKRAFALLTAALLSPQLLCLTHQPCALATAAVYLAARETGTKLPDGEWWEVFDVEREELGFLVVGLLSMAGFAAAEEERWRGREVPLVVDEVRVEVERRRREGGARGHGT